MRSIAVINQKGGVGKTTTAVNLAAAIAATGQRVCLIDLDPQAHASLHLGIALGGDDLSVYDVLTGETALADVRQAIDENLSLMPAHLNLAAAEMELAGEVGRDVILRDKWKPCEQQYDFLIVDCPPSLGILTLNALTTVHEVFLPLQPHFLALHGLSKLLHTIELVAARLNPHLRLTGVVMCMFDSATRLASGSDARRRAVFRISCQQRISVGRGLLLPDTHSPQYPPGRSTQLRTVHLPVRPASHGAEDYQCLAQEVLGVAASLGSAEFTGPRLVA